MVESTMSQGLAGALMYDAAHGIAALENFRTLKTIGEQLRCLRRLINGQPTPELGRYQPSVEGCFGSLKLERGSSAHTLAQREARMFRWPGQRRPERLSRIVQDIALLVSATSVYREAVLHNLP